MTDAPRDTRQTFEWRSHVSIINFDKSSIWKIDLYTVVNKWFKKKKTNMSLKQSPSISVFRFCRWYYLPPVVCRRAHVLFILCVFVCVSRCPSHIAFCFCFVCLRLVYPLLPVSLDSPCLIAPSVFSNVYLQTVSVYIIFFLNNKIISFYSNTCYNQL